MTAFDMHRHPWFFVLCVVTALLAGVVIGQDQTAPDDKPAPVATVRQCPPPQAMTWLQYGFRGTPAPAKVNASAARAIPQVP